MIGDPGPATPAQELAVELRRVVDRLRSMPLARLGQPPAAASPTRADLARALAQRLADLGAAVEGRPPLAVPLLVDAAVGDQVAVTGHDLLIAAGHLAGAPPADAAPGVAVPCGTDADSAPAGTAPAGTAPAGTAPAGHGSACGGPADGALAEAAGACRELRLAL